MAQSKTARCSGLRPGAPSSVIVPQTWVLAASISFFEKPRWVRRSKAGSESFSSGTSNAAISRVADGPAVEDELDVEGGLHRRVDLGDGGFGEALGLERLRIDGGRAGEAAAADGIVDDALDRRLVVAEHLQRLGHGAVDDLEVAAAGELLELDQREVRLDAGGVAVHDQADGAGRRDHRDLGVAEAVGLAERQRLVPGGAGVRRPAPRRGRRRRRAAPD